MIKLFATIALGFIGAVQIFAADEPKPKYTPNFPADIRVERAVTYLAEGRPEKADLYFPLTMPKDKRLPAVVIIHGGGWISGQRDAVREIEVGSTLARNDIVGMSIDYVLATRGKTWPTNLWDCKTAVRWLRVNADRLGIDPDRIGVFGGSAGGHLSAMVALTTPQDGLDPAEPYGTVSCQVKCCVDFYGITDVPTYHDARMLGKKFAEDPELYRLASPMTYIRSNSPPVLIAHGTTDHTVNIKQSEMFADALAKAGVEHELIILQGAGHSFDLQPRQRDLRPAILDFFKKHL